jgi:hypothetical protein
LKTFLILNISKSELYLKVNILEFVGYWNSSEKTEKPGRKNWAKKTDGET